MDIMELKLTGGEKGEKGEKGETGSSGLKGKIFSQAVMSRSLSLT